MKYSSVMLALYIYIVLDRNRKQNFGIFFCVGLSDNPIWINGLIAMLCRIGLVKSGSPWVFKVFKNIKSMKSL